MKILITILTIVLVYVTIWALISSAKDDFEDREHDSYDSWIAKRYPTPESAKLQCSEATSALVKDFPELTRVRGHVVVGIDIRPHWWCVTPDGRIVDPTAHQWVCAPTNYNALPEDAEEPQGKCTHCGDLLFRSRGAESYFCENCK